MHFGDLDDPDSEVSPPAARRGRSTRCMPGGGHGAAHLLPGLGIEADLGDHRDLTITRAQRAGRPAAPRLGLGDPGLPVPRRPGRRDDDHRRLLPARRGALREEQRASAPAAGARASSAQPRHAGAVPRPRAQALRLAALHHLRGRARRCRGAPGSCVLVYPALAADLLLRAARGSCAGSGPALRSVPTALLRSRPRRARWIAACNIVLGVALGIYTGVLLSALGARPLWNSALLGPLFLVSGLSAPRPSSTWWRATADERELLAKADNIFLVVELVVHRPVPRRTARPSQAHAAAARLVLGGPFTAVFWVVVVGLGIVVPLVIQIARGASPDPAHAGRAAAGDRRRPGCSVSSSSQAGPGQPLEPADPQEGHPMSTRQSALLTPTRRQCHAAARAGPRRPYTNPYLAGIGLGLVLLAAFVLMGRGLGRLGRRQRRWSPGSSNAVAPAHAQRPTSAGRATSRTASDTRSRSGWCSRCWACSSGAFLSGLLARRCAARSRRGRACRRARSPGSPSPAAR